MTPRERKLAGQLYCIRAERWYSNSANRLRRNAGRRIKRALRRERALEGRSLIAEQQE